VAELRVRSIAEFLDEDTPMPPLLIDPWLPSNGLAMISGVTGCGKTMLALACAIAQAHGGEVLGWKMKECRVLYVDGEMSTHDLAGRCRMLTAGLTDEQMAKVRRNLFFCCDADQQDGLRSLSSQAGRNKIEQLLLKYDPEALWLDNLSCLLNSEDENDAACWIEMQDWLKFLRRDGYSVVFLHHTGKVNFDKDNVPSYKQRGTSKREDILNTSIVLVQNKDHDGWRIDFTKARSFTPPNPAMRAKIVFDAQACRIVEQVDERDLEKEKKAEKRLNALPKAK
jgi:RecA-family ATPase